MNVIDSRIIDAVAPSNPLRIRTFPTLIALSNGTLILTCRAGSAKDSADGAILAYRSADNGTTWNGPATLFAPMKINGKAGSFFVCYLTELEPGHLLAACLWSDRDTHPGQPLFNAHSGCLPMAIVLSDSHDFAKTWSTPRSVPLPAELGPPSLTNPILKLHNGQLGLSVETNKNYDDKGKWFQRVVLCRSSDGGKTWGAPVNVGFDPSGRIFNWDQRMAVAPDGTIGAFAWTYDTVAEKYLNVHRRLSRDNGQTWSAPEDLGFPDQAGHPAVLPDGRVLLCWVDRFQSCTIRARLAQSMDGRFDPASEIDIYRHDLKKKPDALPGAVGETLAEMSIWTYGLPFAETLPSGEVLVLYYAGDSKTMNIHAARVKIPKPAKGNRG